MTAPTLRIRDLTVAYDGRPAVHHLSGRFVPGDLTAIVGANGAGKSTLLKTIVGDLKVTEGEIFFENLDRREIGYLPQAAEIERGFPVSVFDMVLLGAWRMSGAFGRVSQEMRRAAERALERVRLEGFARRSIGSLSSGQFRRVLFARLILQDARLILLDEPFAAVDARTTADLLDLIALWREEGRTVIAVLHDHAQVRRAFSQTLLLARECIGWGPTGEVLSAGNLAKADALAERWMERPPVCAREWEAAQ